MVHDGSKKPQGRHKPLTDRFKINALAIRIPFFSSADEHMVEVIKGTSVAFSLKVLGAGISFGFNVLLARVFGAEGSGVYFLALTMTSIGTVFGRIGLDNALLRFVAIGQSAGDWPLVKGVYGKGFAFAFFASTAMTLLIYTLSPWIASSVFSKPDLKAPMQWMSLAIVPIALVMLYAEVLKGLKRIRDSQLLQGVTIPALSILGLLVVGSSYGINGAVWAYTFAAFVSCLIGLMLWRLATPQLKGIKGSFNTGKLLDSSIPLFRISVMNLSMNWVPIFMLGIWGTKADVGIFGVATRIAMLTSFILISVNSIAAPKFATLYREKNFTSLSSTARNATKLIAVLASPLLLLFIVAPAWVMGIFGPEFRGGSSLLVILAIGQYINVATGPVGFLLMMSGNERLMSNIITSVALANILLNIILIPLAGPLGAAIANATCLASMNLISAYFVWSRLRIITIPFIGSKTHA